MRIAYITAGAAGMYCGSCMHDNTLAAALIAQGHDALLIPTYTPIRTDEQDVSQERVFFGGINVYLQQKSALFRYTPWGLDRLLDARWLLRWVSRFAVSTEASSLGDLTLSILKGEHGYQRKEVEKLADWLRQDVKPDIVHLTNVILSGMVHKIKERVRVPVLGELQGDDIFLESLPPRYKEQALALIREHCRELDGFVSPSAAYADFMADYLAIPRAKIHVVPLGLSLKGHGGPRPARAGEHFTIGYFARICPEKGLHVLVDAYCRLRRTPGLPPSRLRIAGWLGEHNRAYFEEQVRKIAACGLAGDFEHVDCPDHASKVYFLQGLDVLSVPTVYREPKGLYVLEAWANGVPVVQPRHGSFPELLAATGGGVLVHPEDPADLARGLRELLEDRGRCQELGAQGQEAVRREFTAEVMARNTVAVYEGYVGAEELVRRTVVSDDMQPAARPAKRRRRLVGGVLCVGLLLGVGWATLLLVNNLIGPKDSPGPKSFDGHSSNLNGTYIAPTLESPIPPGKSAVWCAAFQIAWNHWKGPGGQPFQLPHAPEEADRLNRSAVSEADLSPEEVFAIAGVLGAGEPDVAQRIRTAMAQRFPEAPVNLSELPGAGRIAYCYLQTALKFPQPYLENPGPLRFQSSTGASQDVASFGFGGWGMESRSSLWRQPALLFADGGQDGAPAEFALDLDRHSSPNQVVLALVSLQETLAATFAAVQARIAQPPGTSDGLDATSIVRVPSMNWRVEHRFRELEGPRLDYAYEMMQFRLDRSGVALAAEAKITVKSTMPDRPPRRFVFNRPFLLYLKKRDAQHPFFVMWVDNAELLQPR